MSEKKVKFLKRKEIIIGKFINSTPLNSSEIHFIENHKSLFTSKEYSDLKFHIKYPYCYKFKKDIYHNKKKSIIEKLTERIDSLERKIEFLEGCTYYNAHFN